MSSAKRICANRANSRASTGPRTSEGKARASKNARRHGLSLTVFADPAWAQDIRSLARAIIGDEDSKKRWELACCVAAAHIDVMRVREARRLIMAEMLTNLGSSGPTDQLGDETRSKQDQSLSTAVQASDDQDLRGGIRKPLDVKDCLMQVLMLDRYERRARSRRKSASRAFDKARTASK